MPLDSRSTWLEHSLCSSCRDSFLRRESFSINGAAWLEDLNPSLIATDMKLIHCWKFLLDSEVSVPSYCLVRVTKKRSDYYTILQDMFFVRGYVHPLINVTCAIVSPFSVFLYNLCQCSMQSAIHFSWIFIPPLFFSLPGAIFILLMFLHWIGFHLKNPRTAFWV